jgi:hypothetical protein
MSTVKANNAQIGQSVTATNNFTLYQPATPDGTVRLGVGNAGATTSDVITATNAGNVTIAGSLTAGSIAGVTVAVANGGTGATSLAANNVLLGNGTSAVQVVAPGTAGNVLTSNGTTWSSTAPAAGGVTSITAGNGLTGGTITTTGTIALDYYTGSTANNTSFPIGSYVLASGTSGWPNNNSTVTLYSNTNTYTTGSGSSLAGTWRARGSAVVYACGAFNYAALYQRTA